MMGREILGRGSRKKTNERKQEGKGMFFHGRGCYRLFDKGGGLDGIFPKKYCFFSKKSLFSPNWLRPVEGFPLLFCFELAESFSFFAVY
jgi:hypothetical protein